jgi:hypothetical protein
MEKALFAPSRKLLAALKINWLGVASAEQLLFWL